MKRTFSPVAMEKLFQSMIALLVVWLMTWLVEVVWVIVAWPATTVPPCGTASAAPEKPRQIAKLSGWKAKERRAVGGPGDPGRAVLHSSLTRVACSAAVSMPTCVSRVGDEVSERLVGEEIDARALLDGR